MSEDMTPCKCAAELIGVSDGSSVFGWQCQKCGKAWPRTPTERGKWRLETLNKINEKLNMNEHTPLPCPFCGNNLKHVGVHKTWMSGHADDCFLKGKPTFSDDLEAWNRRSPTLLARVRELEEACKAAEQFITNGVALGYITMPDANTPDPAHDTLPKLRAALADR